MSATIDGRAANTDARRERFVESDRRGAKTGEETWL
jgi:hypothetical protein